MKKAILYFAVFVLIQLAIGGLMQAGWALLGGAVKQPSPTMLIATMAVINILLIVVFLSCRWAQVSRSWLRSRPWAALCWCCIAAVGALIPSIWLQELIPDLPNLAEQELLAIMQDRMGYAVVGLLAPVAEELVFRGAILRSLLSHTSRPWLAIALSALFFAIAHFNPAQAIHPLLTGLLLGWMYYRTNSIVPGVAYHWTNNSAAYVLANIYPDPDLHLVDIFGGDSRAVGAAVVFSLLILVPAIYQLSLRLKKAE